MRRQAGGPSEQEMQKKPHRPAITKTYLFMLAPVRSLPIARSPYIVLWAWTPYGFFSGSGDVPTVSLLLSSVPSTPRGMIIEGERFI